MSTEEKISDEKRIDLSLLFIIEDEDGEAVMAHGHHAEIVMRLAAASRMLRDWQIEIDEAFDSAANWNYTQAWWRWIAPDSDEGEWHQDAVPDAEPFTVLSLRPLVTVESLEASK